MEAARVKPPFFARANIGSGKEEEVQRIEPRIAMAGYVRARLQREAEAYGRGYQAHVARTAKVSAPHLANVIGRADLGVGMEVADKLAHFWGLTLSELTAEAATWAQQNLGAPPTVYPPNLTEALDFLRARGAVPADVEETAAKIAKFGDLSVGAWIAVVHDLKELRADAPQSSRAGAKRAAG